MNAIAPAADALKSDVKIISLVGFAHGTSHFFHLMLPPLFPWFMTEFGLGYAISWVASHRRQAIGRAVSWISRAPARSAGVVRRRSAA